MARQPIALQDQSSADTPPSTIFPLQVLRQDPVWSQLQPSTLLELTPTPTPHTNPRRPKATLLALSHPTAAPVTPRTCPPPISRTTPKYQPIPVTYELGESSDEASSLCDEVDFHATCICKSGCPELTVLPITTHSTAGILHHLQQHGSPIYTVAVTTSSALRQA